jgi:hypothetical protein
MRLADYFIFIGFSVLYFTAPAIYRAARTPRATGTIAERVALDMGFAFEG